MERLFQNGQMHVLWNYTQILERLIWSFPVENIWCCCLLFICMLLTCCASYVAECRPSKQRQWLWSFCATGEFPVHVVHSSQRIDEDSVQRWSWSSLKWQYRSHTGKCQHGNKLVVFHSCEDKRCLLVLEGSGSGCKIETFMTILWWYMQEVYG